MYSDYEVIFSFGSLSRGNFNGISSELNSLEHKVYKKVEQADLFLVLFGMESFTILKEEIFVEFLYFEEVTLFYRGI